MSLQVIDADDRDAILGANARMFSGMEPVR